MTKLFYNQRGAMVYKNINKQPMLPLHSGQNEFYVLSVGFSQNGTPLVTISEMISLYVIGCRMSTVIGLLLS